jgi:putative copper export protein
MQAEPLLTWSEPITEFVGFVSLFFANGALGFRYAALRGSLPDEARSASAQRAATLGLLGTLVQAGLTLVRLPGQAARLHLTTSQLLSTDPQTITRCLLLLAAIVGFTLAVAQQRRGWPIALVGLIGSELAGVLAWDWARLVNPVHQLLAGLWLGSLAVMVIAGIVPALRAPQAVRGTAVAEMVNGFSPLALVCGPLMIVTGVITALRHLHPFSALWSTPYGYALLLKLCLVAIVFALGAWNWRRQRPRLGTEEAAGRILRSSLLELSAATLVLMVTAVLVSLPSPKPPRPAGGAPVVGSPRSGAFKTGPTVIPSAARDLLTPSSMSAQ